MLEGYLSGTGSLEWVLCHYYIFKEGRKIAGPSSMSEFYARKVLLEKCSGPRVCGLRR